MTNTQNNNNSALIAVLLALLIVALVFTGLLASGYIEINNKGENENEEIIETEDEIEDSEDMNSGNSNDVPSEVIIKREFDINRDPVDDANEGGNTEVDYETTVETK